MHVHTHTRACTRSECLISNITYDMLPGSSRWCVYTLVFWLLEMCSSVVDLFLLNGPYSLAIKIRSVIFN